MFRSSTFGDERRTFRRVRTPGTTAVVHRGLMGLRYQVRDLSLGGAMLAGPLLDPGEYVTLRIAGPRYRSFDVGGHVVRVTPRHNGSAEVGLAFDLLDGAALSVMESMLHLHDDWIAA